MANTATLSTLINAGGQSISSTTTRTGSGVSGISETLTAAKAGSLTTRTTDTTGVITTTSTHGITDSDRIFIFWDGGHRRNITVSAYDVGNKTITFTAATGGGDVLPAEGTAITVSVKVDMAVTFDGDTLQSLMVHSTQRAVVSFEETAGGTVQAYTQILTANETYVWHKDQGVLAATLGLTGNAITNLRAGNASTTAATLMVVAIYDSTP